jgi:holin-like protein
MQDFCKKLALRALRAAQDGAGLAGKALRAETERSVPAIEVAPMIQALALLLILQLVGETLVRLFALPLPGPVLGLVLLAAGLSLIPRLAGLVRPLAQGLLAHLSLLFVPAGVGVVGHLATFGAEGVAIAVALVVSTILALAVGALVFVAVDRLTGGGNA